MNTKRKVSDTSKAAYDQLTADKLRDDYKKIMSALAVLGEATSEKIAAKMKCKPDRVWKRISEMRKMHVLDRTGNRTELKSGCKGFTYYLTEKGKLMVESSQELLPGKPVQDFSRAMNQPIQSNHTIERLF